MCLHSHHQALLAARSSCTVLFLDFVFVSSVSSLSILRVILYFPVFPVFQLLDEFCLEFLGFVIFLFVVFGLLLLAWSGCCVVFMFVV